jgi:hypothetical protein
MSGCQIRLSLARNGGLEQEESSPSVRLTAFMR